MSGKIKKSEKKERLERLNTFRSEILPVISNIYNVSSHGPSNAPNTMYKITIHQGLFYDYYPMSGKIMKSINRVYTWSNVPISNILNGLKLCSAPTLED
jgi:hypothetical protein